MGKILKIVGVVVVGGIVLIGATVGLATYFTRDVANAGDAFLAALRTSSIESVYNSTAGRFREATTVTRFTDVVRGFELDQIENHSWSSRSVRNGRGRLEGTATTGRGTSLQITMDFVSEDDQWRILSFNVQRE